MTDYTYGFELPIELPKGKLKSIMITTSEGETNIEFIFEDKTLWIPFSKELSLGGYNYGDVFFFSENLGAVIKDSNIYYKIKEIIDFNWKNLDIGRNNNE